MDQESRTIGQSQYKKASIASNQTYLPPRRSTHHPTPEYEVNQLHAKLNSLEKELETANLKALYYSTRIRIAKDKLRVNVEKSPSLNHQGYSNELYSHFDWAARGSAWF
jgi:hypothetical protein